MLQGDSWVGDGLIGLDWIGLDWIGLGDVRCVRACVRLMVVDGEVTREGVE